MAPVLKSHIPDVAGDPDARDPRGSHGATLKLIALGLADSANEDGTGAHPGIRDLAQFAQCHPSTVVRGLRALVALGLIEQTDPGGPGTCATYRVHVERFTDAMPRRYLRTLPRAPRAREAERAAQAREARASEAREARASEARSYVPPSVTNCGADAATSAPPRAIPPWRAAGITRDVWLEQQRRAQWGTETWT